MAYATILVHLRDEVRADGLLDVAIELARRHRSYLIGMAALPPPIIATLGLPDAPAPVLLEDYRRAYIAECERMRTRFLQRTADNGIASQWQLEDAWSNSVALRVLDAACTADLIVASQSDREAPGSEQLDIADRLIIDSGRPVLVVPNAGRHGNVGRRILIGWNGRREAARAVFDALPILRAAEQVMIATIAPDDAVTDKPDVPSDHLGAALQRHGVSCGPARPVPVTGSDGEALLASVAANDADLLVMGCYGHARWREFIFGGATRYVLKHMTVPVLMAH